MLDGFNVYSAERCRHRIGAMVRSLPGLISYLVHTEMHLINWLCLTKIMDTDSSPKFSVTFASSRRCLTTTLLED